MKRIKFLDSYLKLFGAVTVTYKDIYKDKIYGTVIYDPTDLGEQQNFCWYMTEENVPSDNLIELIEIIKNNKFHISDKITIPEDKIFLKTGWLDKGEFNKAINQLFDIEIKMIDEGKETDSFFLHQ